MYDDDICPICGLEGDHDVCSLMETRDWNASFGLDDLED